MQGTVAKAWRDIPVRTLARHQEGIPVDTSHVAFHCCIGAHQASARWVLPTDYLHVPSWLKTQSHDIDSHDLDACTTNTVLADVPYGGANKVWLKDWNGIRVGIVGLVEEEWLVTLGAVNAEEMDYQDFIQVGRQLAADLKVGEVAGWPDGSIDDSGAVCRGRKQFSRLLSSTSCAVLAFDSCGRRQTKLETKGGSILCSSVCVLVGVNYGIVGRKACGVRL